MWYFLHSLFCSWVKIVSIFLWLAVFSIIWSDNWAAPELDTRWQLYHWVSITQLINTQYQSDVSIRASQPLSCLHPLPFIWSASRGQGKCLQDDQLSKQRGEAQVRLLWEYHEFYSWLEGLYNSWSEWIQQLSKTQSWRRTEPQHHPIQPSAQWQCGRCKPRFQVLSQRENILYDNSFHGDTGTLDSLATPTISTTRWCRRRSEWTHDANIIIHHPLSDVKTKHWSSQNWVIKMFDDGILMPAPCSCHNCHLTRGPVTL